MKIGVTELPRQHTEVNVVPMIDILLVLIIVFMLQNLLVIKFTVPPPDGAGGEATEDLVLTIDADGAYAVNTQPIPYDSLGVRLRALYDERPRKVLLIQPHRARPYRDVIRAMDVAKGAGVQVLSLIPTRP